MSYTNIPLFFVRLADAVTLTVFRFSPPLQFPERAAVLLTYPSSGLGVFVWPIMISLLFFCRLSSAELRNVR